MRKLCKCFSPKPGAFEEAVRRLSSSSSGTSSTGMKKTYSDHVVLGQTFSAQEAKSHGFFSVLNPPVVGESVVCYRRDFWLRRGVVKGVIEKASDGSDGLAKGENGALVTVLDDQQNTFQCWAVFLAPESHHDRSYSSIATTEEFLSSNFCSLLSIACSGGRHYVSKEEARISCEKWLNALVDDSGHHVEVPLELQEELLHIFDEHEDPSLYLYTRQQPLVHGARFLNHTEERGHDYTMYYLALNNTLNHDTETALIHAMPLIRRMNYLLLYCDGGHRRLHPGGTVYKGDAKPPSPENVEKLKQALKKRAHGALIRFRQFQSTSSNRDVANKFRTTVGPVEDGADKPRNGFLWTIDIPPNFWGARQISDISQITAEAETLFPPYSLFRVKDISESCCHLEAVDHSEDVEFVKFQMNVETLIPNSSLKKSWSEIRTQAEERNSVIDANSPGQLKTEHLVLRKSDQPQLNASTESDVPRSAGGPGSAANHTMANLDELLKDYPNVEVPGSSGRLCSANLDEHHKEENNTDVWTEAVMKDAWALRLVPDDMKTEAICKQAVKQNGRTLQLVPEDKKNEAICSEAVKQDGWALQFVPHDKRTESICFEAIKHNGGALQFVPVDKKTEAIYIEVVKHGWTLECVPANRRTEAMCIEAAKRDGWALRFVPVDKTTEAICIEAVKQNGLALFLVPEDKKTDAVCREAVTNHGRALEYVPEKKKTEAICFEAVKQNGSSLSFVPEDLKQKLFSKQETIFEAGSFFQISVSAGG